MKVKLAAQVFSNSASAGLKELIRRGSLPDEATDTAVFVAKMDKLWDFSNSISFHTTPTAQPLCVTKFDSQMSLLTSFEKFVESWKLIPLYRSRAGGSHPFLAGWKLYLASLRQLSKHLLVTTKAMTFICARKINQDHVENAHSIIRSNNGFSDHPDCSQYASAIQRMACSINTSEFIQVSKAANCEPDLDSTGQPMMALEQSTSTTFCMPTDDSDPIEEEFDIMQNVSIDLASQLPNDASVAYMIGSAARTLVKKCDVCSTILCGDSHISFVEDKEYSPGALVHVSGDVLDLAKQFEAHFRGYLVGKKFICRGIRKKIVGEFWVSFGTVRTPSRRQYHPAVTFLPPSSPWSITLP